MSRQRVAVCLIMMCAATGMAFAQMGTPNLAPATPTATALNADDETVLVPGFNWSTSTTNISAAQDGTVTARASALVMSSPPRLSPAFRALRA
jgi:hypothetical protein